MIDKLTKDDFRKAKSILVINEKQAEFFMGLYHKFGKSTVKKCKIIPSSMIGKYLTEKMLKTIGIDDYINNIVDIEDKNKNGKISCKDDFLNMTNEEILKLNGGKKFDIVLMNPPYRAGIRFFKKSLEISNTTVTIQPTNWILTDKQNKSLTDILDRQYCEIETLNGNEYFDAGLFADVSINYVTNNKEHKLIFDNKEYNKCNEITKFSNDSLLEEFSKKIKNIENSIWEHIKGTSSYYKNYEENPKENWWIVRLSEIRGHVNSKGNKESSDFYTIISKDNEFMKNNIGKYKDIKKIPTKKGKYEFGYFAFNTKNELNNFINYIKTDFVRGCLRLSKTHSNQFRGCFKTIPWFDFSDEHFSKTPHEIDNWLFDKYDISDEIRKHIEEILPDYYNIRPKTND